MADNELTIILNLDDRASRDVATALKNIGKASDDAAGTINRNNESVEKGMKKQKDSLSQASEAVRGFRKEMFVLSIAVGGIGFAVTEYANRNLQTRDSLRELQASMKNTIALIGSAFAPIIVGLAEASKVSFDFIRDSFRSLQVSFSAMIDGFVYGFTFWKNIAKGIPTAMQEAEKASQALSQKLGATFVENIPQIDSAKNKLKDFSDIVASLNTQFVAGEITSTQFYEGLNTKANNAISTNMIIAQQLKELHDNQILANNVELQDAINKNQEYIALSKFKQQEHAIATQGMMALTMQLGQSIQTNLSNAMTGLITGTMTAKQAFQQLGTQMIKTVVDFFVQKAVAMALDFALGKSFMAANIAAGVASGAALTAAYAPAALAANIASFGGAAVAAASTFPIAATAQIAAMTATKVSGFAEGTDSVPAMLTPGEMIFPKSMADAIRSGKISVSGPGGGGGGGDVNIYMSGVTITSKDSVRELAEELGFEIERRSRNARSNI